MRALAAPKRLYMARWRARYGKVDTGENWRTEEHVFAARCRAEAEIARQKREFGSAIRDAVVFVFVRECDACRVRVLQE